MDIHAAFMHQLMMWIEANIEQKLMLETVAQRAGYCSGICSGCSAATLAWRWEPISVNVS